MQYKLLINLVFLLLSFLPIVASNHLPLENENNITVRVAQFYGDKDAALTYSFDDGLQDHYNNAAPLLEKFGFRGTFFIIPSKVPETNAQASSKKTGEWGGISWLQLKEMLRNGHEIGNHSMSHRSLKSLNDTILLKEIEGSWQEIKDKTGVAPLTFCYPYNAFDEHIRSIALLYHIATRDSCMGIGKNTTVENFNAIADSAIKKKLWKVFMIHGIVNGFDAFKDQQLLEHHLNYVKQYEDKIWISTFANVFRYIRERDNVNLYIKYKHNQIKCVMKSTLYPLVYNQPLTVVFNIKSAKNVQASLSGKKLPITIFTNKVCVDWIPGNEVLKLSWK